MKKVLCLLFISLFALLLPGCSGGSGSSSGGDYGSTANLSSDQAEVLGILNHLRFNAGLQASAPASKLMDAASAHSNYLSLNLDNFGHGEIQGRPGFTGVTPGDRAKAFGIDGNVGEAAVGLAFGYSPASKIWSLVSAPYHGLQLVMSPYRKIGIGNGAENTVIEIGDLGPYNANLLVHPCGGVSVPYMSSRGEIPDPLVQFGLSLGSHPTGTPIYISAGDTIRNVDISLSKDGSSAQETFYPVLTLDNDLNIHVPYFAIAMPRNPLQAGVGYTFITNVTYKNGKTVSKSCKFTTF